MILRLLQSGGISLSAGALLASCAFNSHGDQPVGAGGSASSSSSSSSGLSSSSSGGSSGGSGGAAPTSNDAVPAGAVSFFAGATCPAGWDPFTAGAGRALLPAPDASSVGTAPGAPLAAGEDRTHTHTITGSYALPGFSFVAVGGSNDVAREGTVTLSVTSAPAAANPPYLQLLVCKKTGQAAASASAIPAGVQLFFDLAACPAGWNEPTDSRGRFLVGAPSGASAGKAFGGAPITAASPPTHAHAASTTLDTSAHGVAAFSGCCNSGFGKDGVYPSTETSSADEVGLPYLMLLHCQKT